MNSLAEDIESSVPCTLMRVRKPVDDEALKIIAYKLVYRDEASASAVFVSDSEIAVQIMLDVYTRAYEAGFSLFQGEFLSRPKLVSEGKLNADQAAALQLLSALQNPEATPESKEKIVQMDPALTFRLLRFANSAAYPLVRDITPIANAVLMLEFDQLRQLAIIISMSRHTEKPTELDRGMLLKARMCQQIARKTESVNKSACFLASVVSGMNVLLGTTD